IFLIPQKELAVSTAPYADLFARTLGGQYGALIAAFVIISALGVLNGWTLLAGEVVQCMGRHGGLPAGLSREHSRGAPARALLLTGVLTRVALLLNVSDSLAQLFAVLIVTASA